MSTNQPTTGLDLKLARTARRVQAKQIALVMGVSRSRIGHIEASAVVTPDAEARYRAAIDTCAPSDTSAAA